MRKLTPGRRTILLFAMTTTLATMSNEPTPGTPAQAASFIAAEVARWTEVVQKGNIRIE